MAELRTNWDLVKQQMLNETSKVLRNFGRRAVSDFENRLKKKGVDPTKMTKSSDGIAFITDDQQEYESGKVYFSEVYEEVSDKKWPESIL